MIYLVVAIHVIVSVGLILAILLHSGKGTGVSNLFGGGLPSSFSGTSMIEKNLDRITIALAGTFTVTTLVLMIAMPKELVTATPQQQQESTATPTAPGQTPQSQPAPGGAEQAPQGSTPGAPSTPKGQ